MIKLNCKQPSEKIQAFCDLPFKRMKIDHTGNVLHCCFQDRPIGNILQEGFYNSWKSKLSEDIRNKTLNGELHPVCKGWLGCPYIGKDLIRKEVTTHKHNNYPVGLEIDLPPTHCNFGGENPNESNKACIMCLRNATSYTSLPTYKINKFWDILEKVKFLMPYLEELTILGVAEPFWRHALFDAFDKIDYCSHKDHIKFWTYTNGTIFGQKTQEKYQRYVKHSILNFSIDAATPKTYLKIRRHDFYDVIKKNIINYSKNRDDKHIIKICHNINRMNFKESPQMVKEAVEMGADNVCFNFTHSGGGHVDLSHLAITEHEKLEYLKYEQQTIELGKTLPIQVNIFRNFEQNINQHYIS